MNNYTIKTEEFVTNLVENKIAKEFEAYIKFLRENGETDIIKNGYYNKVIKTHYGNTICKIPRLRNHKFKTTYDTDFNEVIFKLIIELYGNGMSTYRISNTLKEVYNLSISKSTVSNACKSLDEEVKQLKPPNDMSDAKIIYIDAKYFKVKNYNGNKVPFISAIIRTLTNETRVLHTKVIKNESQSQLESFIAELSIITGNKDYLFIVDGNKAITNAINKYYPTSNIQRCLFHVMQNIKTALKTQHKTDAMKSILNNLYEILFADDFNYQELERYLKSIPKSNSAIIKILKDKRNFTFTKYHSECHHYIRTNNTIEQYHSNLEAVSKQHRSYENESSLYRALVAEINRFNVPNKEDVTNLNLECMQEAYNLNSVITEIPKKDFITITIVKNSRTIMKKVQISFDQFKHFNRILKS